jgi:hypothetical protein
VILLPGYVLFAFVTGGIAALLYALVSKRVARRPAQLPVKRQPRKIWAFAYTAQAAIELRSSSPSSCRGLR